MLFFTLPFLLLHHGTVTEKFPYYKVRHANSNISILNPLALILAYLPSSDFFKYTWLQAEYSTLPTTFISTM
jgi:hypothetical protein